MTTLSSLAIVTAKKFFLSHQWLAKRIDLSEKDGGYARFWAGIS
jgi:hypothetical protein